MTVLLVRHTHAGNRASWVGKDRRRPISKLGHGQAKRLVALHQPHPIDRILTSPFDRCIQSVAPLAEARGLDIESHEALAEGAKLKVMRRLLEEVVDQDVVLCSHGDNIPRMLQVLRGWEVALPKRPRHPKASTWVLTSEHGRYLEAHYVAPPRA